MSFSIYSIIVSYVTIFTSPYHTLYCVCRPHISSSISKGIVQHTIQLEIYRRELHVLLGTAVQVLAEKKVLDAKIMYSI